MITARRFVTKTSLLVARIQSGKPIQLCALHSPARAAALLESASGLFVRVSIKLRECVIFAALLITSSTQGEGKTFVATNLVRSIIRQADKRALLIDADLRAPRLHTALGAPSTLGLSDYLRGEADEYRIVQNSETPNLCFIPCGTRVSNPSELLLSERMKVLLETVTPAFDWVILDSPPSLPVHDASSLADLCDGVLFVVRAGETSYEIAKKACVRIPRQKPDRRRHESGR